MVGTRLVETGAEEETVGSEASGVTCFGGVGCKSRGAEVEASCEMGRD